jgi:hypothetical protein
MPTPSSRNDWFALVNITRKLMRGHFDGKPAAECTVEIDIERLAAPVLALDRVKRCAHEC